MMILISRSGYEDLIARFRLATTSNSLTFRADVLRPWDGATVHGLSIPTRHLVPLLISRSFTCPPGAATSGAEVVNFAIDTAEGPIAVEQTRLPNYYRFKAGGSMSVRGYGFEQLSNNDVGSNNIITGSAEVEYRFLDSWSGAAFVDVGNAFNDWDDPDLKRGIGVGIRWYSIAGEIRVDVAQALDFEGKPWQWHITIGTPLL